GVAAETLASLLRYDWPGNVRELKNLLEAAFVNRPARRIALADLPRQFRARLREAGGVAQDEGSHVLNVLFCTSWNKSRAAQKLHWSRMTLYRKMTKYQVVSGGKSVRARDREPQDDYPLTPPDETSL